MHFATIGQFISVKEKKKKEGEPQKYEAVFLCHGAEDTTKFNLPVGYDHAQLKTGQSYKLNAEFRTYKDMYFFNVSTLAAA